MDTVILHMLLPVQWMHTNSIILQPHPITHNLKGLQKSMYRLWIIYFTRHKKRRKIYSSVWWFTAIHLLVATCSHQYKSCRAEAQDLTSLCLMQLDSSLVNSLRSWELLIKWTFAFRWSTHWARCYASRCNKQVVVFCHYYQLMCTAMKLQYHFKRRCHL